MALAGSCVLVLAAWSLKSGDVGQAIVMAGAIALAALVAASLWRTPELTIYGLFGAAVLIPEYPLGFGTSLTDKLPVFHALPGDVPLSPIILFAVFGVAISLLKLRQLPGRSLSAGAIFWPLSAFLMAMLYGFIKGRLAGAELRDGLLAMSGFVLLFCAYIATVNLPRTRRHVYTLLAIFFTAVSIKAVEGLWRFFIDLRMNVDALVRESDQNSLLHHQESFYFLMAFLLGAMICLYTPPSRIKSLSLITMAIVLLPLLANQRRTAIAAAVIAIVLLLAISYALQLSNRRTILAAMAVIAVVSPIYAFATWNDTSLLAYPTQAIKSGIDPGTRDASSNAYREAESTNARFTAQNHPWGVGIGMPMEQVVPFHFFGANKSVDFQIPHNGLWWLAMTTGIAGLLTFVYLVSTVGLRAASMIRHAEDVPTRILYLFSLLCLAAWLIWVVLDRGILNERLGIFMGVQFGLLAVGHSFIEEERATKHPRAVGFPIKR